MIDLKPYYETFYKIKIKYNDYHRCINCIEELSELIKAITKQLRYCIINKKYSLTLRDSIIEEMSDVYITMEEVKIIFNISDNDINCIIKEKMEKGVK